MNTLRSDESDHMLTQNTQMTHDSTLAEIMQYEVLRASVLVLSVLLRYSVNLMDICVECIEK